MGVKVTIAGTDRSNLIRMGSLSITDNINNAPDEARFDIEKYGTQIVAPEVNQEVIIEVDDVRSYGGVIIEVETQLDGHIPIIYGVTCKDFTQYLDRRLAVERYEDTTLGAVVVDLVDRYASEFGFTSDNVQGFEVAVKSVAFNELTLSACFNKLAKLTGYYWYVDYYKDVHFFKKNEELAPFNLDDTSANFIFDSLVLKDDISQLRNTVTVRGGEGLADERTELLTGDGEKDTFPLGNKFSELPVVEVDGTPVTVGVDYLQDPASFDVMWSFQQKYLKFTTGNIPGPPITGETNIAVTGIPLRNIVIERSLPTSVVKYGVYEHVINNTSIKSRDEALQFALSDLQSYADSVRSGSFDTYTPGLRSGQTINVVSLARDFAETFVIQSVQFEMMSATNYKWSVELATIKVMTLIDALQKLLLDEVIDVGADDTLLSFFELPAVDVPDIMRITDELGAITVTDTEDYVVEQDDPGADSYPNPAIINKSTMAPDL